MHTEYGIFRTNGLGSEPLRFDTYEDALNHCVTHTSRNWSITNICNGHRWKASNQGVLAHFEQRGWLTTTDDNGNLTTTYAWFMITGDNNIAKRKIGGRNWSYYGRTSTVIAFVADEKGK